MKMKRFDWQSMLRHTLAAAGIVALTLTAFGCSDDDGKDPEEVFSIEIQELSIRTARILVETSYTGEFICGCLDDEDLAAIEESGSLQAFFDEFIEVAYGGDCAAFLEDFGNLHGSQIISLETLHVGQHYTFFAVGTDEQGHFTTQVTLKEFYADAMGDPSKLEITFTRTDEGNSMTLHIHPTLNNVPYFCWVALPNEYEEALNAHNGDQDEAVIALMTDYLDDLANWLHEESNYPYSLRYPAQLYSRYGETEIENLHSPYIIWAMSIDVETGKPLVKRSFIGKSSELVSAASTATTDRSAAPAMLEQASVRPSGHLFLRRKMQQQ